MLDLNKVAFNAFWYEGLDSPEKVFQVCEQLAGLGYRGVEWKETCFGAHEESLARLDMAVRASQSAGLEVTNFVILRNLTDPATAAVSVDQFCAFARASAAAGVRIVNTGSSGVIAGQGADEEWWRPGSTDWHRSWDLFEQSLSKLLAVAESEGVVIALEPVVGALVHDYYSALELLRRLESPSLALTFDPSHFLLHDNDIPYAIRRLKDNIRHVHVKDAVGRPGVFGRDFLFPILGEGAINWQGFFGALDEIGYDGWMSVEFESFKYMAEVLHGDAAEAARLSMRSFRALTGA